MDSLHLLSHSNTKAYMDILLKPVLFRGLSGLLHLTLLLCLLAYFVSKRFGIDKTGRDVSNTRPRSSQSQFYKLVSFFCFGVSVFNAGIFLFIYFYWYKSGWTETELMTMLDSALKMLSWAALAAQLRAKVNHSSEFQVPALLRVWLAIYLCVSCYSVVVDIILDKKHPYASHLHDFVSDGVSALSGVFLNVISFLKWKADTSDLDEPLLNGNTNASSYAEPCKLKGSDTVTPYATAGIFSILSFYWMGSLIAFGNQKTLDLEDVPQLAAEDSVTGVFPVFKNSLESSDGSGNTISTFKLVKAVFAAVWKDVLLTALLALIYTLATYVGPYLIDSFVLCLDGRGAFKNQGYLLASAFFVAKLVECLAQRHWFFRLQKIGLRMRAVLIAIIYKKSLTLSSTSKQGQTSGEIINIMSVDAERIGDFSWYMHDVWLVFIQVGLALAVLYKNLGIATLATFAATIVVMLLNYPAGRLQEKYQEKVMAAKDSRMKATSEILRNMRILKLQAWEMKFLSKIMELRKTEEGWLKKLVYTIAIIIFLFWIAPTFVAVTTFGSCMLLEIPLESGKILSALATFRILQEPIYNLPDTVSMIIQAKVSLDRIASFLHLEDLELDTVQMLPKDSTETAMEIADASFSWDSSSSIPVLKDLNVKVFKGMRVAVCGTVGSGKSSLLSCILGELPKISGELKLSGTRAYVAQSPWIQSGKIEDNILFGKEMNREKYDKILEACSLKKDLEILSFGDQTIIGERGINMSGGQKQRIQIARALYQDADIYLFDDPFSAVDAHTGTHLFKEVLLGLLSSKTVIYVTHQVEFLPAADLILVMKDGKITQTGVYDEILSSGSDFMELVGAHKAALSALDSKEIQTPPREGINNEDHEKAQNSGVDGISNSHGDTVDEKAGTTKQLIQEEEREKGQVGFHVYWKYLTTAYGGALVPLMLLSQTLFQVFQIGSNYWMAWATPMSKDEQPAVSTSTLLIIYGLLALASALCILSRAVLLVTAGYKTATLLFNKMHLSIFRAPMSFFDATPSGRILSRASTDQSDIDMNMALQVGSVAFSGILLLSIIAVMSQVAWQVFIVFIPVVSACIWYQQYYISSARELSRLAGVCKAPLIQHFSETISGSTTIRSFDQQSRFVQTNMRLIDAYSRPKFHNAGAMEWLCCRLDMFSAATFAFSLFFLVSFPTGIDPAIAGLAVTYGLNLNMIQAWVIWNVCNMENKIISVERVLQYMSIPSEPPLVIEDTRPDKTWPSHGEIEIDNLQIRYAPHMPLVLRGLTCNLPGGQKTGIVGRTGSGKSTLIQALFRIVDPASGRITIDKIDITSIGLHDLRSRLSIIPQDPTMFEGTIRSNLDPLEEYSDEQIWEALEKCQLGDEVRKSERKLDSAVVENGENWSMGQRQLVCLGRVLLKKSKVLVLDEATASVDTFTDNLIQQTLKEHFSDCTVITIAHRITSVLDSDKVLLLSHGLIEEFDSPTRLLANKSSSFSKLVAEYTSRSNTNFEKLA